MQLFLIQFELSVPFEQWESGFLDHQAVRESAGIEDAFYGQLEESDRVMVGLKADSQAVLDQMMQSEGANIEATGHILDTTEIQVVDLVSES